MLDAWSSNALQHDPMRLYRLKRDHQEEIFHSGGEGFDCLTERSWRIGDTRSLDDRLQASWIKTEATTNMNTTYEIIELTIAADEQPEATANSTQAARHAEGSRADSVGSNTNANAGVDSNSNANSNTNLQPSANSTSNSNFNLEPKISPDKPYANANPTSPPTTTTGAQTTTHTEASESQETTKETRGKRQSLSQSQSQTQSPSQLSQPAPAPAPAPEPPPKPLPKADTSSFFFINLTPTAIPTVLIDTTLAVALDWSIAPDAVGGTGEDGEAGKEGEEEQEEGIEYLDYDDVRGITRYFDVAPNPNATLRRTACKDCGAEDEYKTVV
ncbi:hypothetical protein BJ165DRAFT_1521545 [Panaeolus papilionaceus]|nr:hypothetical protein BJ165DRAFT_1521545 [Panaeolus papilionaceus]